jgi:hypothetical protein
MANYQNRSGYQQVHLHFHAAQQATKTQSPTTRQSAQAAVMPATLDDGTTKNMIKVFFMSFIGVLGGIAGSYFWFPAIALAVISLVADAVMTFAIIWQNVFGNSATASAATQQQAANNSAAPLLGLDSPAARQALSSTDTRQLVLVAPRKALSQFRKRLQAPSQKALVQPLKRLIAPFKRLPRP